MAGRTFRVGRLADDVAREIETLTERIQGRHLNLAVTGLRRSGKTVFITSLVHHLLDGHALPFVEAVHDERYFGARLLPVREAERFPYETFHAALSASPPSWPRATERLTRLRLELRYRTDSPLLRYVQPRQELTLEIIDYPGEWLLDLPLLEQSYDEFSRHAVEIARQPLRQALARPWLEVARGCEQAAPAEEAVIRRLAAAYAGYLQAAQAEIGLSLVQPGRFTSPGDLAGSELLAFAPLPDDGSLGHTPSGSLRAVMAARYERYKDEVVRRFYTEHFRRFDRQIVLVDLLRSLNAGPEHFADTQAALTAILASFRYGRGSWLGRIFAPRIDRVLFAASKADHVAPSQHAALKQLLELMIGPAARHARLEGLRPEVMAIAALRCTDVVKTTHQGQVLSCLKGRLKEGERETVLFPGEIPPELPEPQDWTEDRFRFYEFAPRRLQPRGANQHIRLDQAIEYLLGDRLR